MKAPVIAYLGLGSNVGDRMGFLAAAEAGLAQRPGIQVLRRSKVYETEPWPNEKEAGPHWFLNQVLEVSTTLSPQELLKALKDAEKAVGRTAHAHWGPREIDLDILLFGDQIIDLPALSIPHPHLAGRAFMLIPLLELAPAVRDPLTRLGYDEILEKLSEPHRVTPFF